MAPAMTAEGGQLSQPLPGDVGTFFPALALRFCMFSAQFPTIQIFNSCRNGELHTTPGQFWLKKESFQVHAARGSPNAITMIFISNA